MTPPSLIPWTVLLISVHLAGAQAQTLEYLSDCPERLLRTGQDWGALGYDVAAHAPDRAGEPLRIGDRQFSKGLGHHANGALHVLLDGEFDRFEAQVGLQPCAGGSVVFRVLVDGAVRFDSGVVRTGDAPRPVSVALGDAQELTLEANDAGDGISCDMANWAEARLHRARAAQPRPEETSVDIAPFGRVVTWDPDRMTGTLASRIEEFPAADLRLESELQPAAGDIFDVAIATRRMACLGLQWLNRRAIRELRIEFVAPTTPPAASQVRVEGWFGESAWQGEWKRLLGECVVDGHRLIFRASPKPPVGSGLLLTRKVRWIWPVTADKVQVRRPVAFTRSRWGSLPLLAEWDRPANRVRPNATRGRQPEADQAIQVFNGEFVGPRPVTRIGGKPQPFTVRHSLPGAIRSDPTLLRIVTPGQPEATVAVEDLLAQNAVYLPDLGLLLCRADRPVRLADYRKQIAGRRTILEEVRALPDQTLEQAMAKTHHAAQREGPVLLSLAGDNTKYIVERDGTVRFSDLPATRTDWPDSTGLVQPRFGPGQIVRRTRQLAGDWLPIPVITTEQTNLVWRQRTFVAPVVPAAIDPANPYAPRASVCVIEFSVTNPTAQPADAELELTVLTDTRNRKPATLTRCAGGYFLLRDNKLLGRALTDAAQPLAATARDGVLEVRGSLPAHAQAAFVLTLPSRGDDLLKLPDPAQLLAQTRHYWDAVLSPAAQIETPDRFLNDLIRSSQVRCLIAGRHEADGERVAAWIAAISYGPLESEAHSVIRGMDVLGHREFARRSLDYFIHRYSTNGFLTTGYTTFGTAWHLWTLGEHDRLTRDRAWLAQVAPELKRVGRWILAQTAKSTGGVDPTQRPSPWNTAGLMPPGVMADWNAYAYHFCLNAYYAAALNELGHALTTLGDPEGAPFTAGAQRLAEATSRHWESTAIDAPAVPLRNGAWVRYYPSQRHSPGRLGDFFPGDDAGRSWCYDVELGAHQLVPAGVLPAGDRAVTEMLDHMEDVQFLESGWFDYPAEQNRRDWFNLGGFSKVQPYYTRNCEIYAMRDDIKPFVRSYFNTLAAMVNPEILTFWEHFNHSGAWDKTHETGYFLHQTRTLFVTERREELWLAPFIPSQWLQDGQTVKITNAPTQFGPVSFRLESHVSDRHIDAFIDPPTRQAPAAIMLRLRHPADQPIRSVLVNGRTHRGFSRQQATVTLRAQPDPIRVVVRY